MSEPFLAEVRMVGFNFAPKGWAFCDGQVLPINQNQTLYSLLGTSYGGDGRTNFALPDLRGRTPIHVGEGHDIGQKAGTESVKLAVSQIPAHTHTAMASSTAANQSRPAGAVLASADVYRAPEAATSTALKSGSISNVGGSQPHNNMQPYIVIDFCIALKGLFPSRN